MTLIEWVIALVALFVFGLEAFIIIMIALNI